MYVQVLINGILIGGIYGLMALGLSLIFGVLGIINFAHGNLMVLGMYAAYWLFTLFGFDPYLSLLVAAFLMFGLGFLIQWLVLNPIVDAPMEVSFLVTLGIALIIQNLLLMFFGPDYYSVNTSYRLSSIPLGEIRIDVAKLYAFAASIAIAAIFLSFLQWTETGRVIRAASNNREAALLMGINVKKIYCIAFAIGAATVAAAAPALPSKKDVSWRSLRSSGVRPSGSERRASFLASAMSLAGILAFETISFPSEPLGTKAKDIFFVLANLRAARRSLSMSAMFISPKKD